MLRQVDTPAWRQGFLFALAATALWGLAPSATKASLAAVGPDVLAFVRLVTAAGIFRFLSSSDPRTSFYNPWVWLAGVALAADFLLYSHGLAYTTASTAGLVVCVEPVATIALAVWLLGDRWNQRRVWGSTLTLGGVGIASIGSAGADVTAAEMSRGNLMIVAGAVLWSVYAVAQRKTLVTHDWPTQLHAIFTVAALIALPFAALHPEFHLNAPLTSWMAVAVVAFLCTAGVYLVYAQAQRLLDVSVLSLLLAGIPALSLVWARLWLGEELSIFTLGGAVFVVAGAVVLALEPISTPVAPGRHQARSHAG